MSCIGGTGLGHLLALLGVTFLAFLLATLLNSASFLLQIHPRSTARRLELWIVFVTPLAVLTAYGMSFVL